MGFLIAAPGAVVFESYANGVVEAQGAFLACGVFVVEREMKAAAGAQEQKIVV